MTGTKICTKCGECKPATTEFFRKKGGGLEAGCKPCMQAYVRAQHDKHKVRRNAERRQVAQEVRDKRNADNRERYAENRDELLQKRRAYVEVNKQTIQLAGRVYREANKAVIAEKMRSYRLANKRKVQGWKREWLRRKITRDPVAHAKRRVRALINIKLIQRGFTKKSSTSGMLGCDWPTFANHLERQFLKGMTWENRSEWHIDHIIPLATAKTEEDVIRLNHYTNLRPLWAKDNLRKGARADFLI